MTCAYCASNKKQMTREHVIPNSFIKGMNSNKTITWSDKAPIRTFKGDIVVKDVCAECNNEFLSILDNYAIKAITKYNGEINHRTKKIFFKYDFNKISRWLLKVVYNSARASGSKYDSSVYEKCCMYILGKEQSDLEFSIYLQFIDLNIKDSKEKSFQHFDKNSLFSIDHFRISTFYLKDIFAYNCIMRTVIINSFAFYVIVYEKNVSNKERARLEAQFTNNYPNANKIIKESKKIKLIKDSYFWKESLVSNVILRENFLMKRDIPNIPKLIVIELKKVELLNLDFHQIIHFIRSKSITKDSTLDYFQKFEISIDGYNQDTRELWEITEFRSYIRKLIDFFPEIIWFLNLKAGFFPALLFAYVNFDTSFKQIDVNRVNLLFTKCFNAINHLTHTYSLDHSHNIEITELFKNSSFKILGINNS